MKITATLKHVTLLGLIALMIPALSLAQRHDESVRVKVRKTEDGHVERIEEDVPAAEAEDLEGLMKKYGVEEELGKLEPGEEVEIVIRRKKNDQTVKDMKLKMDRESDLFVYPHNIRKSKAFLGVHYELSNSEVRGSYVTEVVDDTPASRAGLMKGDVITAVDGENVHALEDLSRIIGSHDSGDKVKLTYVREGRKRTVDVTLGDRPTDFYFQNLNKRLELDFDGMPQGFFFHHSDEDHGSSHSSRDSKIGKPFLGVTLNHTVKKTIINGEEIVEDSQPEDGVKISGVTPNSAASEMDLRKGDVIKEINGKDIDSYEALSEAISGMEVGEEIKVTIERDGNTVTKSAPIRARTADSIKDIKKMYKLRGHGDNDMHIQWEFDTDGAEDSSTMERMHQYMEEALSHMEHHDGEVREFKMVIRMEDVSAQEAQALSEKSGQQFSSNSNLAVNDLRLAPNPSNGMFNVSFDLPERGDAEMQVMDVNGNVVYKETLNDFSGMYQKDFDISGKAKGVYFLQILQNGKAFSRKIVTQ